jgi:hypothetical protein
MNLCPEKQMRQRLRACMVPPQCHLIAGRAAESRDRARMDVVSQIDGRFTTLADGGVHEIDAAVAAAPFTKRAIGLAARPRRAGRRFWQLPR